MADLNRRLRVLERRLHRRRYGDAAGNWWGLDPTEVDAEFEELVREEVAEIMAQDGLSRETAEALVHAQLRADLDALREQ